jgi:hypothetical protein
MMDCKRSRPSKHESQAARVCRVWTEEKEFIEAWLKQAKPTEGAERTWRREDAYDRKVFTSR